MVTRNARETCLKQINRLSARITLRRNANPSESRKPQPCNRLPSGNVVQPKIPGSRQQRRLELHHYLRCGMQSSLEQQRWGNHWAYANTLLDPSGCRISRRVAGWRELHWSQSFGARMCWSSYEDPKLSGAVFDKTTTWPEGFNPMVYGAVLRPGDA